MPSSPAADQPPPLFAPRASQWALARRVPLCLNPPSASDVEVVELRASLSVCVTASTCRRRADVRRHWRESEPARFKQDALLIRDGECNKHAKQESYFCAVADGGVAEHPWVAGRIKAGPAPFVARPHLSSRLLHSLSLPLRGILSLLCFSQPSFATDFTSSNIYIALLRIISQCCPHLAAGREPRARRIIA